MASEIEMATPFFLIMREIFYSLSLYFLSKVFSLNDEKK